MIGEAMAQLCGERDAALADLSQARAERDMALEQRDAAIKHAERLGEENARLAQREPTNDEMERVLAGGDEAFLGGTIRRCRVCRCAVFGGPTACVRCVEREDRNKYKALLGHAVAALQMVKANRACSSNTCATIVDAILDDPTATAAVDAYRASQEERARLDAAVGALYRGEWASNDERDELISAAWAAVKAMWPKVDARRGGGR
jgi:hypothetical protein